MDQLYRFPHPADVIARDAEATRHWSAEDRLVRLLGLIAAGWELAHDSPVWQAHRRAKQRSEAEWQRACVDYLAQRDVWLNAVGQRVASFARTV